MLLFSTSIIMYLSKPIFAILDHIPQYRGIPCLSASMPRLRIQPILSDTEVYTIPTLGMGGSGWAPVQGPVQRLETLDRMLNNIFYISIEERIISLKTCHCRCILFWHRIIFQQSKNLKHTSYQTKLKTRLLQSQVTQAIKMIVLLKYLGFGCKSHQPYKSLLSCVKHIGLRLSKTQIKKFPGQLS